jgi:endonuclease/exonuclease/phosphatase family metal-dependent hydrolase
VSRLRAVTWNLHHGVGTDGRLELGRIARVLRDLDPDVAGLQEVDRGFDARSDRRDQAGELAEALGLHLLWAPAIRRPGQGPGGSDGEYGVALLTRAPAVLVDLVPMQLSGHEPRVVLQARAGGLTLLVTHLDFGSRSVRRRQAERVAGLDVVEPAVLLADLNARPQAPELAPLTRVGWRDAWAEAPDRSGGSWPFAGATVSALPSRFASGHLVGRTQPARFPVRRVDAVLVRGGVRTLRAEVPRSEASRAEASDHRPLVVDLELPGPSEGPSGLWQTDRQRPSAPP